MRGWMMVAAVVVTAIPVAEAAETEDEDSFDPSSLWMGESRLLGVSAGIGPRYGVEPGVAATVRPATFLGLTIGGGVLGPSFQGRLYPRGLPVYLQASYGPLISGEDEVLLDDGRIRYDTISYDGASFGVGAEMNRGLVLIDVGASIGEADLGVLEEDVFSIDLGIGVNVGDRRKLLKKAAREGEASTPAEENEQPAPEGDQAPPID